MSKHIGIRRIATLGGALALAVALPLGALAEVAEPTTPTAQAASQAASNMGIGANPRMPQAPTLAARSGFGIRDFGIGTGTGNLTEAQKAAYQDALNAYVAAEDEQLANLVGAGVLTQDEADACKAQRANRQLLGEIDMSNWSSDQMTALKEAFAKPDEERAQALAALATVGQLTQAQADALNALADGQASVWQQISGQTDDATLDALDAMQHAQLSYMQALERAGIGGDRGGKGGIGGWGANEKIERGMKGTRDFGADARDAQMKKEAAAGANGGLRGGIGKGL